jgi:anti-sigma regulatory factor (Ser/Thr protein kinase)
VNETTWEPAGVDTAEPRSAVGGRPERLDLEDVDGAIGLGRDFARALLHRWHWPELPAGLVVAAEDVVLVVSELVTNAAVHGRGVRDLLLQALPGMLRIEVRDRDLATPRPRDGRPGTPGGYGLHIVERLATEWGYAVDPGSGKTVWALIPAPWPSC